MIENSLYDKKSLRLVDGKSANLRDLAWDCVAFANAQGGVIAIGIEDDATSPPNGQRINDALVNEEQDRVIVTIKKRIIKEEVVEFLDKADKAFQLKQCEMISLGLIAQHDGLSALEFSRILDVSDQEDRIRSWLGRLPDLGLISTAGRTRGMTYFVPDTILKKLDFKGRTTLKRIEGHRLEELIRHDLERYGGSAISDIQKRIGSEISTQRIRDTLGTLINGSIVEKSGYGRWSRYSICKNEGK